MKAIPPDIQELMDKVARHHVHKCPVCLYIWGCQTKECKPKDSLLARTPCPHCQSKDWDKEGD